MPEVFLIGIGTGNPLHLTQEAMLAIRTADLVLLPHKEAHKAELAQVRLGILATCGAQDIPIAHFDMPLRRQIGDDYSQQVDEWHEAIAHQWHTSMAQHPHAKRIALLIWGDPALYDSSLRIAARLQLPAESVRVIPGITSMQALCSAHRIAFNDIGSPFQVTTGRRLREHGWPANCSSVIVMLDGNCAFESIDDTAIDIYWGAYLGMPQQLLMHGPLSTIKTAIRQRREAARQTHGWIMDIYLLRKITALS